MNLELIEKIKKHSLGNKEEAFSLYFSLCDCLKEKYGCVDKDFDEKPTKRGKEWLDIHHILEYELDDIARRTENARYIENELRRQPKGQIVVVTTEVFNNKTDREEIRKLNPNAVIYGLDYYLKDLKKYNVKEQLVYANKIEHFLLHYLIDSIRGINVFSGGPNYLWDCSVSLDLYGSDQSYINNIKGHKEEFYSIMSSQEITKLYKKLLDWKGWDIDKCIHYWTTYRKVISYLDSREVSYIENNDKFFELLDILQIKLKKDIINKIKALPYKARIIVWFGDTVKEINDNLYSLDEKTLIKLNGVFDNKSVTIPNNIEKLANTALLGLFEAVNIPVTVLEMDDNVFDRSRCIHLKKVYYKGTKEMWNARFSNVKLDRITLVCKKYCYE